MGSETRELSPWSARRALTMGSNTGTPTGSIRGGGAEDIKAPVQLGKAPEERRKSRSRSRTRDRQTSVRSHRPVEERRRSRSRSRDTKTSVRSYKDDRRKSRSRERKPRGARDTSRDRKSKDIPEDPSPAPRSRRGASRSPAPYRSRRERSNESRRDRSKDRKRDRSTDRRRDRSRDRRRDTSRDKYRDRSRDRRRDRSGDRHRDRSRDAKRDRSRDRRRDDSREKRRDRSKDRKRSLSPPSYRRNKEPSRRSRSPLPYRPSKRREPSPSPPRRRRRSPSPPPKRRRRSPPASPHQRARKPLPDQEISFRGLDDSTQAPTKYGGAPIEREKPNFKPTGLLAKEANKVEGTKISLKYHEPPEARKPSPSSPWRLWIFKGEDTLGTIELHTQSCWLLGRAREVADIPLEHPSASQQHAAIQFRYIQKVVEDEYGVRKNTGKVKPYIIDLDSSNGTELNGEVIEKSRYFELRDKDILKFGASEREYMVMLPPKE